MNYWPALLGWPAIALALVLAVAGIVRRNAWLPLAAIVPLLPIGIYVLGSPTYWWLTIAVFGMLIVLSLTLRRSG